MSTTTLPRIHPITPTIGAVISDVDLRGPLDPEAVRTIRDALLEHGVVFFRGQDISRDQLQAFAASFGQLGKTFKSPDAVEHHVGEMVTTAPKGTTDIWHADSTYMESPPLGAVLRAVRLPPVGGDTCWASMYAAYEALSEPMRNMLDGLTAVHSVFPVVQRLGLSLDDYLRDSGSEPTESVHPVIRVHPETGRKLLFVNQDWTHAHRRAQCGREQQDPRAVVRACQIAGLQYSLPLGPRRCGFLGQSSRPALCRT